MTDTQVRMFTELARLFVWLFALCALFVPLESWFPHIARKKWRKGISLDISWYFVSSLAITFLLAFPVSILVLVTSRFVPGAIPEYIAGLPVMIRFVIGMIASEIGYYWGHRLSHENAWLWSFHSVHHSSEELDFLSNTRAHPVDLILSRLFSLAPLYLIGIGSTNSTSGFMLPVSVTILATMWGYFIHANLKWRYGILEKVVATPPFHHWHHTAVYPMKINYSTSLPLIDMIFGTFHLPHDQWPGRYGIDEPMPQSLMGQLLHPFVDDEQTPGEMKPQNRCSEAP